VNCDPTFKDHPKVINGASDFLLEIFGEKGKHTRVAVGVSSLPLDSVVEIDMICEAQ
jgi:enamine deaminase RidA (YjgF/YER057c/UK114 family)